MERNRAPDGRRWISWFGYCILLLLATAGIASVLIVRSTRELVGNNPGRDFVERLQQS